MKIKITKIDTLNGDGSITLEECGLKITKIDTLNGDGSITLEECGLKIGEVLEVDGHFNDGSYCVIAPRNSEFIQAGDNISVSADECEVVEE